MAGSGPRATARVAIIGESPGGYEDARGTPFVGQSGDLLNMVLADVAPNWTRRSVFISNAVRCRPPANKTNANNTRACKDLLLEELAECPKVQLVIALGNEALWSLTGSRGITAERGIPRVVQLWEDRPVLVVPTFHPAMILRDQSRLAEFVADLELAVRVFKDGIPKPPKVVNRLLVTDSDWEEFGPEWRGAELLSYDIETNTLKPWDREKEAKVLGISFCADEGRSWFAPLDHPEAKGFERSIQLKRIEEVLLSDVPKSDHNGQFEDRFLGSVFGFTARNVVFDTAIAWHMQNEDDSASGGGSLDALAARWTPLGAYKAKALEGHTRADLEATPLIIVSKYGGLDSDATRRISGTFRERLQQQGFPDSLMAWELRKRKLLASMESRGAEVDWEYHADLMQRFPRRILELDQKIDSFPDVQRAAYDLGRDTVKKSKRKVKEESFLEDEAPTTESIRGDYEPLLNVNSNDQLKYLCFKILRLQPVGDRLTDAGHILKISGQEHRLGHEHQKADGVAFDHWLIGNLAALDRDLLLTIRERRQVSKVFSTYVENLWGMRGRDGRIHTNFAGSKMVTWRVSSSEPNLQNLPRKSDKQLGPLGANDVKRLYIPPKGWKIVSSDYSQLELRIIGILAQDSAILDAFDQGVDIHKLLASRLYQKDIALVTKDERNDAKPGNFGCAYLMSVETLAINFGLPLHLARRVHAAFWSLFHDYEAWVERQKLRVEETWKAQSLFGHVRHLGGVASQNRGDREGVLRQGVNFPVQATASNLCLYAQAIIEEYMREWGWLAYNFLHVHDQVAIAAPEEEVPQVAALVKSVMTNMPFDWLYGEDPRFPRPCPIVADVEVGDNLRDLKPYAA